MSKGPRYLLDVNVLVALSCTAHIHYELAAEWFYKSPALQWRLCAFAEAGFLRSLLSPHVEDFSLRDAMIILEKLTEHPGYSYLATKHDWRTLSAPFLSRIYGNKQITNAYLSGIAIREDLVLATFDKSIRHLAGEDYGQHVLTLLH